ncbi:hypothetical protein HY483_04070 [Candidatus Woesearchaeota archaeon]|nr:hypothetical protein [Candidatus Woesearchaeota archaeon]
MSKEEYETYYDDGIEYRKMPEPPKTNVPLKHKIQMLIPGMIWYTRKNYERIFNDPREEDGTPVHSEHLGSMEILRAMLSGVIGGAGIAMHQKNPEDNALIPLSILATAAIYSMWTYISMDTLKYFRGPAVSRLERELSMTRDEAEQMADSMYNNRLTITDIIALHKK